MNSVVLAVHFLLLAPGAADPCEAARASQPVGVIQGVVRSEAEGPRVGVRIRATIAGSGREVATTSDRAGRYVLDGLDVGADVELRFSDAANRIEAGCWVSITQDAPDRSVDVVLDNVRLEDVTRSIGCQGVSLNDSWVTVGDRSRLVVDDLDPLPPAPITTQPVPRLELRASDIELTWFSEAGVDIRLRPAARHALAAFTAANVGRVIVITIEGLVASARVTVQGAIDSGVIRVNPSALRGRLCEILESAPHANSDPPAR